MFLSFVFLKNCIDYSKPDTVDLPYFWINHETIICNTSFLKQKFILSLGTF